MKGLVVKTLAAVLSGCILLTACSGSKEEKKDGTRQTSQESVKSSIVTEPGTFPIVKDKYTLKIFASQPNVEDMNTNELTVKYEQKTNVHINWEIVPSNALTEKRKISLSSGDYPDVYMAAGITREEELVYSKQGIFIPMNDLIDSRTVWLKDAFQKDPSGKSAVTAPDGKIYSLPFLRGNPYLPFQTRMWINTKWLKQLNLQPPKTTDDLYKALKAFKENDPNGNGKKDEIPFIAANVKNNNILQDYIVFFMNSFIQCDLDGFLVKDGKVDAAYNKEEWKKGLDFLKQLYSEGLLDTTLFTCTSEQLMQIGEKADAQVMGSFVGVLPTVALNMSGERQRDYDSIANFKGPDGVQYSHYYPFPHICGTYTITKNLKDPEVAIRWVDWFYSFEGALESRIGREGIEWRRAEPDEKSYTGAQATWAKVAAIGALQNYFWGQWSHPHNLLIHPETVGNEDIYSPAGIENRQTLTSKQQEPLKPKEVLPPLYISAEDLNKILQPKNDIKTYVNESLVRFVTGEMDIDKDWDKYISKFDSLKLKDVIDVYQKAYHDYLKTNPDYLDFLENNNAVKFLQK